MVLPLSGAGSASLIWEILRRRIHTSAAVMEGERDRGRGGRGDEVRGGEGNRGGKRAKTQ